MPADSRVPAIPHLVLRDHGIDVALQPFPFRVRCRNRNFSSLGETRDLGRGNIGADAR